VKPYFEDDAVTIYHLTNVLMCDNLSLDNCTEVYLWMPKKEHGDIGQDSMGRIYPNSHLAQEKATSKLKNILRNVSDLVQNIITGRGKILPLPVGAVERSASFLINHVRCAVTGKPKDTMRTMIRVTTNRQMSYSFVANAI